MAERPTYSGKKDQKQIKKKLTDILNGKKYAYDASNDNVYGDYKQSNLDNARRAADQTTSYVDSTIGRNTYADKVSSSSMHRYQARTDELVPSLAQADYQKYLGNKQTDYNALNVMTNREASKYSRHRDKVSDYEQDRQLELKKAQMEQQRRQTEWEHQFKESQFEYDQQKKNEALQERIAKKLEKEAKKGGRGRKSSGSSKASGKTDSITGLEQGKFKSTSGAITNGEQTKFVPKNAYDRLRLLKNEISSDGEVTAEEKKKYEEAVKRYNKAQEDAKKTEQYMNYRQQKFFEKIANGQTEGIQTQKKKFDPEQAGMSYEEKIAENEKKIAAYEHSAQMAEDNVARTPYGQINMDTLNRQEDYASANREQALRLKRENDELKQERIDTEYEGASSEDMQKEIDDVKAKIKTSKGEAKSELKRDLERLQTAQYEKRVDEDNDLINSNDEVKAILDKYVPGGYDNNGDEKKHNAVLETAGKAVNMINPISKNPIYDGKNYENLQAIHELDKKGYDGKRIVDSYIRSRDKNIADRERAEREQFTKDHFLLSTGASSVENTFMKPAGVEDYLRNRLGNAISGEYSPVNYNSEAFRAGMRSETTRNTVAQAAIRKWGPIAGAGANFGYQIATSMMDSLLGMSVLGEASAANMAMGAAADTARQSAEKGLSDDQVAATAFTAGVAELIFESIELDQLQAFKQGKANTVLDLAKNMVKGAINEGAGEAATEVLNETSDRIINQDLAGYADDVINYMDNEGLSFDEAKRAAEKDYRNRVIESAAAGGISGFFMSAGTTFYGTVQANKMAKNLDTESVIETGMEAEVGTEARALAGELQTKLNNGERITGSDIVELHQANIEAINEETSNTVNEIMEESESDKSTVKAVNKAISEGNVTGRDARNILADETARNIVSTMSGTEITADSTVAEVQQAVQAMPNTSLSEDDINNIKSGVTSSQVDAVKRSQQGTGVAAKGADIQTLNGNFKVDNVVREDGNISVLTTSGEKISLEDVVNTDSNVYDVLNNAARYDNNGAKAFVTSYDGSVKPGAYTKVFDDYYNAGLTGETFEEVAPSPYHQLIPNSVRFTAFSAGQNDAKFNLDQREEAVAEARNAKKQTNVDDESKNITKAKIINAENASWAVGKVGETELDAVATLAGIAGVKEVEFYKARSNEARSMANGYIKNGKIFINKSSQNPVLVVLAHELTHYGKTHAPKQYEAYKRAVIRALKRFAPAYYNKLMNDIRNSYSEIGQNLTNDELMEELVSNASEAFITNPEQFREAVKKDPTFGQKVVRFLSDFVDWIKGQFGYNVTAGDEAKILESNIAAFEEAAQLWQKMLEVSALAENQMTENQQADSERFSVMAKELTKDEVTLKDADGEIIVEKADGLMRFNQTTYKQSGRAVLTNYLNNAVQSGEMTEKDARDMVDQMDELLNISMEYSNKYGEYGAWAEASVRLMEDGPNKGKPVLSCVVSNGEYEMNIDFSTVCKKRKTLNAVLNALVKSGKYNLYNMDEVAIAQIQDIIKKNDLEVACRSCFVDSKRYRIGAWAKSFTDMWNDLIDAIDPDSELGEFNYTGAEGRATGVNMDGELTYDQQKALDKVASKYKGGTKGEIKPIVAKMVSLIKENPKARNYLNDADLVSSAGMEPIKSNLENLWSIINQHQGTAKPKSSYDETQYQDEILNMDKFSPEKAFAVGGVRVQSFSDYMGNMWFDYVQMISNMAAKKLPSHSYTKELDYIRLFGMTGMKINMSLMPAVMEVSPEMKEFMNVDMRIQAGKNKGKFRKAPTKTTLKDPAKAKLWEEFKKLRARAGLDDQGNYVWATETFRGTDSKNKGKDTLELADEWQSKDEYTDYCGTIAVGVSDAHIEKLLNDDRIRMVIPYHKSGINHIVAAMGNIDLFMDYTNSQNTTIKDGNKTRTLNKKNGEIDFDWYGHLKSASNPNGLEARECAYAYIDFCNERGYTPKFAQFAYEKNADGSTKRDASGKAVKNPNYYKLLIDFVAYNNKGEYVPQEAVRMNFPEESLLRQYIEDSIKEYVDINEQRESKLQPIISEIEETLSKNEDVRYSLKSDVDNTGRRLSKGQMEFFKNSEVVDKDGNLMAVYTGTSADFNEFMHKYIGRNGSAEGYGFYFTNNEEKAKGYKSGDTGRVMKGYLNITNPLSLTEKTLSRNEVKNLIKSLDETGDLILADYDSSGEGYPSKAWYNRVLNEATDIIMENDTDVEIIAEIANIAGIKETLETTRSELGYDGYITRDKYSDGDVYVAFESNQFKNEDNLNPTDSKDVRYSLMRGENSGLDYTVDAQQAPTEELVQETLDLLEGYKISETQLEAMAKKILKNQNVDQSQLTVDEIKAEMRELAKYLNSSYQKNAQTALGVLQNVAKRVMNSARVKDDSWARSTEAVRNYLKTSTIMFSEKQMREAQKQASKTEIRRALNGKVKYATVESYKRANPGVSQSQINQNTLDAKWGEMSEMFPEWFPADSNDQVSDLMDAVNAIYDGQYTDFSEQYGKGQADEIAWQMANEMMLDMLSTTTPMKNQEKWRRLRTQYSEKLKSYKEMLDSRYQEKFDKLKEKYQNRETKVLEAMARQKESYSTREEMRRENGLKNKYRTDAKKIYDQLYKMINDPTESKYIPTEFVSGVADVCAAINFDTGFRRPDGEPTQAFMKLDEMKRKYESLKSEGDLMYGTGTEWDARIPAIVDEMKSIFENDKKINELTTLEMKTLVEDLSYISDSIRNATKLIGNMKGQLSYETGVRIIEDIKESGGFDKGNPFKEFSNTYWSAVLSPERFFRKLVGYKDDSPMLKLAKALTDGEARSHQIQMEAEKIMRPVMDGKENAKRVKALTGSKAEWVDLGLKDEHGKPVLITPAMKISLYLHSKNAGNVEHIENGGIKVPDQKLYEKGDITEAYARGTVVRHVTKDFLKRVEESMTDYEKQFAKAAFEVFNTYSKNLINATSQQLSGFDKARVKNYFPIVSDSDFLKKPFDSLAFDKSIENASQLKKRQKGASNPIMLQDVTDALTRQIQFVSQYAGLAIPLSNLNKVLNVTLKGYESSMKHVIKDNWGSRPMKYIEDLVADLNGARASSGDDIVARTLMMARGNLAGAVLTGNMSVTMKQAASYPTAAAVLGYKALGKAMAKLPQHIGSNVTSKKFVNEHHALIDKYTGEHWARRSGSAAYGNDLTTVKGQNTVASAIKNVPVVGALVNSIQEVDIGTTSVLWDAAEYYVQDNFKNLDKGSDAYYRKVAEIYNKAIHDTQPNYSVMQRPDILRSTNQLTKVFTMFMTQRLQNGNIMYDATANLLAKQKMAKAGKISKSELKTARVEFARSITSQLLSATVLTFMTLASRAMLHKMNPYRDEDKDVTMESLAKQLFKDGLSSIAGSFLGGSSLYDFIASAITGDKYYGINDNALGSINDLATATRDIIDGLKEVGAGEETWQEAYDKKKKSLMSLASAAGQITGIPVSNIYNMLNGVGLHIEDARNGEFGSFESDAGRTSKILYGNLYRAYMNGDDMAIEEWYNDLVDSGKSPKQIDTAMKQTLRDNNPIVAEAAQAKVDGNTELYVSKVDELKKYGFSRDVIVGAVDSMVNLMDPKEKSEDAVEEFYSYDDIVDEGENTKKLYSDDMLEKAVAEGDMDTIDKIREDWVDVSTAKEPEKSVDSKIKSTFKAEYADDYTDALLKHNTTEVKRLEKLFKDAGIPEETYSGWASSSLKSEYQDEYKEAYLKGDATKVKELEQKFEAAGIENYESWGKKELKTQFAEAYQKGDKATLDRLLGVGQKLGIEEKDMWGYAKTEQVKDITTNVDDAIKSFTGGGNFETSRNNAIKKRDELVDIYLKQGKTEKEAHTAIKSSITSYYKPLYKDMSVEDRNRLKNMLYEYFWYDKSTGNKPYNFDKEWLEK